MSKKDLVALTPEEQAFWEANKPKIQEYTKYNRIFVDNIKMTEDGNALNPNFGKLFAEKAKEEPREIDISKAEFKIVIIRSHAMPKNSNSNYYCEESDNLSYIKIFDKNTKEIVTTGNYFDLMKEYDLKSSEVLYVQYEGDFYKWKLSFGGWETVKEFLGKIRKLGKPAVFKIDSITPTQNGSNWFNTIKASIVGEYPIKEAVVYIKEVKDYLNNYYAEKETEVPQIIPPANAPEQPPY